MLPFPKIASEHTALLPPSFVVICIPIFTVSLAAAVAQLHYNRSVMSRGCSTDHICACAYALTSCGWIQPSTAYPQLFGWHLVHLALPLCRCGAIRLIRRYVTCTS